jgi:hypothetical protein
MTDEDTKGNDAKEPEAEPAIWNWREWINPLFHIPFYTPW